MQNFQIFGAEILPNRSRNMKAMAHVFSDNWHACVGIDWPDDASQKLVDKICDDKLLECCRMFLESMPGR